MRQIAESINFLLINNILLKIFLYYTHTQSQIKEAIYETMTTAGDRAIRALSSSA